jgi:hypothetical protein
MWLETLVPMTRLTFTPMGLEFFLLAATQDWIEFVFKTTYVLLDAVVECASTVRRLLSATVFLRTITPLMVVVYRASGRMTDL